MGANIEWIVGILRIGKDFHKYGDPWEFKCLVATEGDTIHLFAIESESEARTLVGARNDIRKQLPAGVTKVRWERIRNGIKKDVIYRV